MREKKYPTNPIQLLIPTFLCTMKAGISRSAEFARKLLAEFAVNIGLACGNCCRYCSSRVMFRRHPEFRRLGLNPFDAGYAVVDPDTVSRVQRDAGRIKQSGRVIMCSATDAYSEEGRHYGLGRGCAEAILNRSELTLRVLTKRKEVQEDFDVYERYRERVLIGLSTSFLPEDSAAAAAVEPYSSSPEERLETLRQAHRRGLPIYDMLCPMIPAFYQTQQKVDEAFKAILEAEPEEIFAEVVNPRGKGLIRTAQALRAAGLRKEADGVDAIRTHKVWSREATRVIQMVVDTAERLYDTERLRVLLYPSRLTDEDEANLRRIRKGIIWL